MFNPNELNRVGSANSRVSAENKVNYDLAYSNKTKKFRVSPFFFDSTDLENNGLTLYEQRTEKRLILAVEPNEKAVMHRGRENYKKGREFTASRMRFIMNQYGFTDINEFQLKKLGAQDGVMYFEITSEKPKAYPDENTSTSIDAVPGKEAEQPEMPDKEAPDNTPEVEQGQDIHDPFAVPGESDQFLDDTGTPE